jgi:hypothetical protein
MIDELQKAIPEYGGRGSHARCFLHTTNLIAKSLISMFDVKKKKIPSWLVEEPSNDDQLAREIDELGKDLDQDEQAMVAETEGSNVKEGADDTEGLVDLAKEMEPEERAVHEARIRPVMLVLVKVSMIADMLTWF